MVALVVTLPLPPKERSPPSSGPLTHRITHIRAAIQMPVVNRSASINHRSGPSMAGHLTNASTTAATVKIKSASKTKSE